ncbi:MAG: hypothetical protein NT098_02685, partial [Candidatus Parcubacteria bacterium]|nr:hypothetical protein [Candidatus Parcubacteria bacterium]
SLVIDTPVAFSAPLVETFVVPQETVPAVSGPEPVVQSVVEEAVSSNAPTGSDLPAGRQGLPSGDEPVSSSVSPVETETVPDLEVSVTVPETAVQEGESEVTVQNAE